MENIVFWMWAQQAFGVGSGRPWHIYKSFPGGLEGFYREGARCWNRLDYVSESQAAALAACTLEEAMVRLDCAMRLGWQVVTPECEQYPGELRNISDPPAVLYSKGAKLGELSGPKIAVVGARKAVPESLDAARGICYRISMSGGTVVTGEASGVDGCAMEGVISARGRAACVLAVDLTSSYMATTSHLRKKILDLGGTLITEYFSQNKPDRGGFQLRNRLITGLCRKVVLVQAAEKSGTMIYARHAAKQGRELFVFPGPEGAEEFAGSRRLLKEGASPVITGGEVLGSGAPAEGPGPVIAEPAFQEAPPGREEPSVKGLPSEQQAVLDMLYGGERTVDELAEGCGMEAGKLLRLLTRMELAGQIESAPGRRYRRLAAQKFENKGNG